MTESRMSTVYPTARLHVGSSRLSYLIYRLINRKWRKYVRAEEIVKIQCETNHSKSDTKAPLLAEPLKMPSEYQTFGNGLGLF